MLHAHFTFYVLHNGKGHSKSVSNFAAEFEMNIENFFLHFYFLSKSKFKRKNFFQIINFFHIT